MRFSCGAARGTPAGVPDIGEGNVHRQLDRGRLSRGGTPTAGSASAVSPSSDADLRPDAKTERPALLIYIPRPIQKCVTKGQPAVGTC